MHSTEVGPVQAIPDIVYRLATEKSTDINTILKKLIVVVPAANPDGSHLVTDYFNETAGTDFTRTYPDLYHPYTGHDDNRDWLFFTQKESQTRIGVFKKYRPVVEHILHQAGSSNPRMWVPPWDDGISDARSALQMQASNSLGMDIVAGSIRGQEGRLLRQRLRDLGHVGHRQLRDLHGLGARAVRDREPEGSRLPVHQLRRQAARQPGPQHAQPAAVRQEHLDARAGRRLPRVRGLARAGVGGA